MLGLKRVLLIGAAAAAMVAATSAEADACWWWRGCAPVYYYPACYTSCYATCYEPCCGGAWYLGVRPGPIRRLLLGPYRYYWVGTTCYYTPCVTYSYPTVCCGETSTVVPPSAHEPTPAKPAHDSAKPVEPAPAPVQPGTQDVPRSAPPANPSVPAPADSLLPPAGINPPATQPFGLPPAGPGASHSPASPTAEESGLLTIYVPADAKVTVNGYLTKSTGTRRQYVSYGLKPGLSYRYEIKAEVVRNGEIYEETRTVVLTAGSRNTVAFSFNNLTTGSLASY